MVTGMRPRLFLFLLLVLLGHGVGLSWLQRQLQDFKPLLAMPDPLFTRIIEAVPAAVPVRPPGPRLRRPGMPPKDAQTPVSEAPSAVATAVDQSGLELPSETPQPEVAVPRPLEVEPGEREAPALESGPAVPAPAAPASDDWPVDTRLSYQLKGYYRGDLSGSARVQWQREQSRYQVRVDLSMALVLRVSMISQGQTSAAGLLPSAYEEQFPWSLRRLAFDGDYVRLHDGTQLPQPSAVQDTASQFVELSHRFSSGRDELKVGSQISLWLARPQGMAWWTYDVIGEETLELPQLGPVPAFHLRPRPIANPTGVITAELWFAPALQYLPVRVRISLGADNFVDLLVERIEQGARPAAPEGEQRVQP